MALLGVSEAARFAGRDVSSLHRAMKSGRLSFDLDGMGRRQIDTAELERVFGCMAAPQLHRSEPPQAETEGIIAAQRVTIEQQDATIRDLRARLDAADARLDRLMLSDNAFGDRNRSEVPPTLAQPPRQGLIA